MVQISVIMPVLNGKEFLSAAIDSIINQTFTDWQMFIDTSGSTDGATELAKDYAKRDKRIIIHDDTPISRMPQKINRAINIAQGKYIARMDGDDIALPERLKKQYNYMEQHPEVTVLGTRMQAIDRGGNLMHLYKIYETHDDIVAETTQRVSAIAHPTAMMNTAIIKNLGGYREQFVSAEDLDLWMRLIRLGHRFHNLTEVLFHYRNHGDNATKKNWYKMNLLTVLLKLNHRIIGEGKEDIFTNLKEGDISVYMVRGFCKDMSEMINHHSSVLFGLVSEASIKNDLTLANEIKYCLEQMLNANKNPDIIKQIINFFGQIQAGVNSLPLAILHMFFQIYRHFADASRAVNPEYQAKILQLMTNVGMVKETEELKKLWGM